MSDTPGKHEAPDTPGALRRFWALVEARAKAAGLGGLAVGVVAEVLNATAADNSLLGSLPSWAQAPLVVLLPMVGTFAASWSAKHTPRPNLDNVAHVNSLTPLADPDPGRSAL